MRQIWLCTSLASVLRRLEKNCELWASLYYMASSWPALSKTPKEIKWGGLGVVCLWGSLRKENSSEFEGLVQAPDCRGPWISAACLETNSITQCLTGDPRGHPQRQNDPSPDYLFPTTGTKEKLVKRKKQKYGFRLADEERTWAYAMVQAGPKLSNLETKTLFILWGHLQNSTASFRNA